MSRLDERGRQELSREYAAALREFVSGAGEEALTRAYMLGRKAASDGVGLLDMAMLHHAALNGLGEAIIAGEPLSLAGQFLAESLSAFEMTLRAYQENARLLGLTETQGAPNSDIARSREQLRVILDATVAVIYLKDAQGRYLFVNRAFQEVFGRRREEVIGRSDRDTLPPDIADALLAADRVAMEGRTPTETEHSVPRTDGVHTLLSLKFPLLDETGEPYALCCVATDITERKQRDEALSRAVEAAEAANRELESFSYSVAHDLRSPLRAIDGFGQALLEDCGDRLGPQGEAHVCSMRAAANHMAQLIDGLLSLARVARETLHRRRVDLSALCRGIAQRLQGGDPSRSVTFVVSDGIVVDGDEHLIRALLENLLGNAWKFTSKCAAARIEFDARLDGRPPVFVVRDNGAGFEMAYADKLFQPFQRLHRRGEFDGTGIGLATVHRIVQRHGGRVWAEAELGRGAAFYFTLEEPPPEARDTSARATGG